jgi:very-short-patch-repair endonuclease
MRRVADRQHGNVTRSQLLGCGFSPAQIERLLWTGALEPVFRGVYRAGRGPEPALCRTCAAVLTCRPRALVTGASAARGWGLPVRYAGAVQIAVVGRRIRGPDGVTVRSLERLGSGELRRVEGIPFASPALTLLELAGSESEETVARCLNEARVLRLVTELELRDVLASHPTRRGGRALRALLDAEHAILATESEAEALCLELMRSRGLEPDRAQARIAGHRVDFLFAAERLVVEVDGYRYHGTRRRFVLDRRRVAALMAAGFAVFPVSWHDLADRPDATMDALEAALLARRAALGAASSGAPPPKT